MGLERLLIADAGPIITLAAVGRFGLLRGVASEVVVPRRVFEEVVAGAPRPGANEIHADWIHVAEARRELADAFALIVDRGEAEALALAKEMPASMLVVDDLRARRVALELGMRFTGTLGILGMAKRLGLVRSLRTELESLRGAGFRIAETISAEFLGRSGE